MVAFISKISPKLKDYNHLNNIVGNEMFQF